MRIAGQQREHPPIHIEQKRHGGLHAFLFPKLTGDETRDEFHAADARKRDRIEVFV